MKHLATHPCKSSINEAFRKGIPNDDSVFLVKTSSYCVCLYTKIRDRMILPSGGLPNISLAWPLKISPLDH